MAPAIPRTINRATVAPSAYGHYLRILPNLARVYHACIVGRAIAAELTGRNAPCFQIMVIENIISLEVIFFLTVINVLLYSKYPMALDGYVRTVGKRLSGGL